MYLVTSQPSGGAGVPTESATFLYFSAWFPNSGMVWLFGAFWMTDAVYFE